jgi:hypothetical protein
MKKHRRLNKLTPLVTVALLSLGLVATANSATAFHEGGLVELNSHTFTWVDPESGGVVEVVEEVFEGCQGVDPAGAPFFNPHDMTFQYVVANQSFDPIPGITNGFSGFQILFPGPVPELYNQQSPAVGGPWQQNAFSGQFPPFGVEWDVPLPNLGVMPGEIGVFSYCTFERIDVVVEAPDAGWFHTWGLALPEPIIDADGTLSPLDDSPPGFVEVQVGDPLTAWPTGRFNEGLDMFDNDLNAAWTFGPNGDDLHVEDPVTHPGAIRDGFHDDFLDPIVLDIDGSLDQLPNKEPVSCDMESGTFCPAGLPGIIRFFDSLNPDGFWNDGEDIVLDVNNDFIFGEIDNIQTFITNVPNSVPGELLFVLDLDACSTNHEVCKKVKYLDEDRDGVIEVGESVQFLEVIQVHNPSPDPWMGVIVKDRWGAEIDVVSATPSQGTATLTTKGKSAKEFLEWNVGTVPPGGTANLVLMTMTDLNPAGHQQYTSPGDYDYNSGAVLKFQVQPPGAKKPHQRSFDTGSVMLTVVP